MVELNEVVNIKRKIIFTFVRPLLQIWKSNFPKIDKLKDLSKQIGYSGHYSGIDDAIVAICKGATYVEKHFTIDNDLPGRDNKFAILPKDLKQLCQFAKNFKNMSIDHGLDLQEFEKDIFNNYRKK